MALTLFNTLTKQKELFQPLEAGRVRMYNCGPTVYGRAHIGNFASYLFADFLRRHLEVSGYEVKQVKNITDVGHLTQDDFDAGEDKLVAAAKREGKGVEEVARRYTDLYLADEQALQLLEPMARPRASAYVPQQMAFVQSLVEQGQAYVVEGNVYFDVSTFPSYGKLSGNSLEALKAGARVEVDARKRHPADFLLWRAAEPDHLMQWPSPWGPGYPGWHIECSVMARELLGDQIDIHTGGEDNIFPHHESEIAQTESITHKPFAQVWMHRRHILVEGEKMSKSKGNVYTLDDIRAQGFDPLDFRFLVFSTHYRSRMDFSWAAMQQAREGLKRIRTFFERVQALAGMDATDGTGHPLVASLEHRFVDALNDDMNTPEALAALYEFVREGNALLDDEGTKHSVFAAEAHTALRRFDYVLSVLVSLSSHEGDLSLTERAGIEALVQQREEARKAKDFAQADALRDELTRRGIMLEDTPQGVRWKKRSHKSEN